MSWGEWGIVAGLVLLVGLLFLCLAILSTTPKPGGKNGGSSRAGRVKDARSKHAA